MKKSAASYAFYAFLVLGSPLLNPSISSAADDLGAEATAFGSQSSAFASSLLANSSKGSAPTVLRGGRGGGGGGGGNHGGNNHGGNDHHGRNPGRDWNDHRGDVDKSRHNRHDDLDRRRREVNNHRNEWQSRRGVHFGGVDSHRGDMDYWRSRYDRWWDYCPRPVVIVDPGYSWTYPMPSHDIWDYAQVELVAGNLEYLSEKIYDTMEDPSVPYANPEYGVRLQGVLVDLIGAATNYDDAVKDSDDWSGSIDDLFYLDQQLSLTEKTLNGFSQEYRVREDVREFRYYVDELLWQYQQNY